MDIYEISREVVSPVLATFVEWVIKEAEERKITTLYFLARDGYILREIGQRICQVRGNDIRCRYLYCSRMSLNLPVLFLGEQKAFDYLFTLSTKGNLLSVMIKAGLSKEQQSVVQAAAALSDDDLQKQLDAMTLREYREKLTRCPCFIDFVRDNSRKAYITMMEYLHQEGVMDQQILAIVDSGWSCSSQHALRMLMRSEGFSGSLLGLYFGIYNAPTDKDDGEALGWFFTRYNHLLNKVLFSPDLFECMLSAPHGMTVGYEFADSKVIPQMKNDLTEGGRELIRLQERGVMDGLETYLKEQQHQVNKKKSAFRRLCAFPKSDEAAIYEGFTHCDDAADNYRIPLISDQQIHAAKQKGLSNVLVKKGKKTSGEEQLVVWPAGVISLIPNRFSRWLHWFNLFAAEWVRWMRIYIRRM